jgi:hypothetical protein
LKETLIGLELKGAVLSVHNDGDACEPRGNEALEERSPRMGVHDVRSFTAKHALERLDKPKVVAGPPVQLEHPDVRR